MHMTPEQVNTTLKAVSQSIISIRKRLADWRGPPDGRAALEHELGTLTKAREWLEHQEQEA